MTATFRDRTTRQRKPRGAASEPAITEAPAQSFGEFVSEKNAEMMAAARFLAAAEREQKRRQRILRGVAAVLFALALIALVAVGRAVT